MLKHIWTVLCSRSIIDAETNNISLVDVIEQVELKKAPKDSGKGSIEEKLVLPLTFTLVNFWVKEKDAKEFKGFLEIEFSDPRDKVLSTIGYVFDVPVANRRMRTRTIVAGLTVNESGIYKFRTKVKFNEKDIYTVVEDTPLEVLIS